MTTGYLPLAMVVFLVASGHGGEWVRADPVNHVVGDDRGWDLLSDLASWSSGRVFRVGDKIWFAYSAAKESIAEVKTRAEFEACDPRKAIKMYTDGVDSIQLLEGGIRYFVSGNAESCKKGLKLHVPVTRNHNATADPAGALPSALATPPRPSGSLRARGGCAWVLLLALLVVLLAVRL